MYSWLNPCSRMNAAILRCKRSADARAANDEQLIRSYNWALNWGLAFGRRQWDTIAILPSVAKPDLTASERSRESLARRVIIGKDIGFVERLPKDKSAPEVILLRWVRDERTSWSHAQNR